MIKVRKSSERGNFNHGWLKTSPTFSFSDYYDPKFMGFRALRVINEDFIGAAEGFPTHAHRDMEIITYIIDGALEHKDTLGTQSTILPGEVQYMSAGKGIRHSEFNHLKDKDTHLLQIWIMPDREGHTPRYGQKSFLSQFSEKNFVLTISPDGREGSIGIHRDAMLWVGKTKAQDLVQYSLEKGRYAWLQIVKGSVTLNDGSKLEAGDGASISDESALKIQSNSEAEFLFFDLD
jgi:redox-sensitive bicupin YhaK (pirin superfamily)